MRRPALAVAVAVFLALASGCGVAGGDPGGGGPSAPGVTATTSAPGPSPSTAPGGDAGPATTAPTPSRVASRAPVPVEVVVPAIGVDADIVPVGLKGDGEMVVPDFGQAGWYDEGPRPGEAGPAVIVAHVSSRRGPDVFARLAELDPGDRIQVRRVDGTQSAWVVTRKEQTDKDDLPVDRIWNDTEHPVLRLVTCGGTIQADGHYDDNVIVYADQVAG